MCVLSCYDVLMLILDMESPDESVELHLSDWASSTLLPALSNSGSESHSGPFM